jgi:hypothetical protein
MTAYGWGRHPGGRRSNSTRVTAADPVAGKAKAGAKMTGIVRLQGALYAVSSNKRTLRRRSMETVGPVVKRKLEGQIKAAEKVGGGLLRRRPAAVASRNRLASAAVSQSRRITQRSRLLKIQQKNQTYCKFYNIIGKCDKMGKGCPYLHDKTKVAVCRRFLHGTCRADPCPLSHKVAPEKMPVCFHFLRGACVREDCPYRHVKVGKNAPVCPDFLKGYCPAGVACAKQHIFSKAPSQAGAVPPKQADAKANGGMPTITEGTPRASGEAGKATASQSRPPASFKRLWARSSRGGAQ